jgi:hypothetical protein
LHERRESYAKSDAWKKARRGFIPALERLPGLRVEGGTMEDDDYCATDCDDEEDVIRGCAACKRMHTRATAVLTFMGRPYWPDYTRSTKSAPLIYGSAIECGEAVLECLLLPLPSWSTMAVMKRLPLAGQCTLPRHLDLPVRLWRSLASASDGGCRRGGYVRQQRPEINRMHAGRRA